MSCFFQKYWKTIFITILLAALFCAIPYLLFHNLDRIAMMLMPKLDVNKQTMQQIADALSALRNAQIVPPMIPGICGAMLISLMYTKCCKRKHHLFAVVPLTLIILIIMIPVMILFTQVNCVRFDKVITALLPLL